MFTVEQIKEAQAALNKLGVTPSLAVDGVPGRQTAKATLSFQIRQGLQPDGILGPITLAALRIAADPTAPKPAIPAPGAMRGLCIEGLLNETFSEGMITLRDGLNAVPGCRFNAVHQGIFFYEALGTNFEAARTIKRAGGKLGLFGHSMGADEVWKIAAMLAQANIDVDVAISIDPTCWGNNGGNAGQWVVPKNVKIAGNFRQAFYPGGGRIIRGPGFVGEFHEETIPTDSHVTIDNDRRVLNFIKDKVILAKAA